MAPPHPAGPAPADAAEVCRRPYNASECVNAWSTVSELQDTLLRKYPAEEERTRPPQAPQDASQSQPQPQPQRQPQSQHRGGRQSLHGTDFLSGVRPADVADRAGRPLAAPSGTLRAAGALERLSHVLKEQQQQQQQQQSPSEQQQSVPQERKRSAAEALAAALEEAQSACAGESAAPARTEDCAVLYDTARARARGGRARRSTHDCRRHDTRSP